MKPTIEGNGNGYFISRAVKGQKRRETLNADGSWSTITATYFRDLAEVEAFGQGLGLWPIDYSFEQRVIEEIEKKQQLIDQTLELKSFPTIDRLIREGKRGQAVAFAGRVPAGVFKAIALDRARNHNP